MSDSDNQTSLKKNINIPWAVGIIGAFIGIAVPIIWAIVGPSIATKSELQALQHKLVLSKVDQLKTKLDVLENQEVLCNMRIQKIRDETELFMQKQKKLQKTHGTEAQPAPSFFTTEKERLMTSLKDNIIEYREIENSIDKMLLEQ